MDELFNRIADDLAADGYCVADQFLSQTEATKIASLDRFKNASTEFRKAGIGKQNRQVNEGIRGDHIKWIDKENAEQPIMLYLDRVDQLRKFLNQSLFLSLKDFEVHMTIYPAGSFYKRHLDQFRHDDHRRLSVICYLNENWLPEQGGQLRMFFTDREESILPLAGRLVCFRSDLIEHEVLPATRERLSLTGWMLDQLSDLRHL